MIPPVHRRVAYLGLCFALLFTGFNVIESFLTTIFPGAFGYASFYAIYAAFAASSVFVASSSGDGDRCRSRRRSKQREKWSIFAASLGYLAFLVAVCAQGPGWLVLCGSVCVGWSAGTLWNSQGKRAFLFVRYQIY